MRISRRVASTERRRQLHAARISRSALPTDDVKAARLICEEAEGGIPGVAEKIGYPPGVLYNRLSGSEDPQHRPSVADYKRIHLATGRIDHLQALARIMGCVAFPIPDLSACSDEALLDMVSRANEEEGEYYELMRRALADGEIDAKEAADLDRKVLEWVGAVIELHNRVKGVRRV